MTSTSDSQQPAEAELPVQRDDGAYRIVCPDCGESREVSTPESNTHSVRDLCDSCWQKRIQYGEIYLQAGPDRHHYICRCGWQTWAKSTPWAVRILGLPCFHCGKRWKQTHRCPACEGESRR